MAGFEAIRSDWIQTNGDRSCKEALVPNSCVGNTLFGYTRLKYRCGRTLGSYGGEICWYEASDISMRVVQSWVFDSSKIVGILDNLCNEVCLFGRIRISVGMIRIAVAEPEIPARDLTI